MYIYICVCECVNTHIHTHTLTHTHAHTHLHIYNLKYNFFTTFQPVNGYFTIEFWDYCSLSFDIYVFMLFLKGFGDNSYNIKYS